MNEYAVITIERGDEWNYTTAVFDSTLDEAQTYAQKQVKLGHQLLGVYRKVANG